LASETRSNDVMILFSDTLRTIVNGEISQMFTSRCKPGIDEYYKRIYAKTASLFQTSALAAAIISGADEKTRHSLSNYGREIGMAFQIEDDILDFTGDEAVMGKPKGSDLRQGLITLPAQVFFENNSSHPLVKKILEFGCLNENNDVNHLVSDILESDSIEKSHRIADGFIERSAKALNNIPDSVEKEMLSNLAQAQVRRKQ
jgi:geranylgeranyl pyrophosphate synthase